MSAGRLETVERAWPTVLVVALCAGIAAGVWIRIGLLLPLVVATSLAVTGTQAVGRRRVALTALSLALVGVAWGGLRAGALERTVLGARVGETASARVLVTGPAKRSRYAVRAPAVVLRFGRERMHEHVLLRLPPERAPPQGVVLEVRARPERPRGPETGFDERAWLARQGVHVVLVARDARIVGRRGGIGGVADRLRGHVVRTLASGTTGERRALVTGIVLGEESELARPLRDAFRASGLTHLLAVSGQNVAITALGVVVGLRLLGVGRLLGETAAIAAVLAYALAAGWQPSVVRAAVAGCLASLAWLSARSRDRWHAMAIGALVLLAWSPYAVLEPGFQLSFAAVASIFVVVPRLERWLEGTPLAGRPAEALALAGACGLVTAPIVFLQFGAVPVWTVPANLLAEPAMPPLVACSLLAALVEPASPAVAASLAWLAGWCAAWIAFVARLVSGLPGAQLTSTSGFLALSGAVLVALGVRRLPRHRRPGAVVALSAAALAFGVGWWALRDRPSWTPPAGLRLTVLDVGQGDGILVEVPEGALLVDAGPTQADVAGQLRRRGVRALSAVLLTHPHPDHVGGAPAVLRRLAVGTLLDPELASGPGSPSERAALAAARERAVPVEQTRAGARLRLGVLRLDVLWPEGPGTRDEDPNVEAVVMVLHYRGFTALLTGDAESIVTLRLRLPHVDVLKVAHHGSEDPGLPELLRRLRPRVAVISVGAGNDYGHPRPTTLAALAGSPGLVVHRTDLEGAITIESAGGRWSVTTER